MTGNIIRRRDGTRSQLRNVACFTGFPVVRSAPLKPKSGLNEPPASLKPNSGLSATHPPAQDAGRVGQPRERLRKVWESLPLKPESGLNGTPALTQAKLGLVGHPPSRTRRGKDGATTVETSEGLGKPPTQARVGLEWDTRPHSSQTRACRPPTLPHKTREGWGNHGRDFGRFGKALASAQREDSVGPSNPLKPKSGLNGPPLAVFQTHAQTVRTEIRRCGMCRLYLRSHPRCRASEFPGPRPIRRSHLCVEA